MKKKFLFNYFSGSLNIIKVATSSELWEPNRTKFSKCNPNLTKPNTKNLDPNQTKLRFFDTTQTQTQTEPSSAHKL
jgi:hypothetical protein